MRQLQRKIPYLILQLCIYFHFFFVYHYISSSNFLTFNNSKFTFEIISSNVQIQFQKSKQNKIQQKLFPFFQLLLFKLIIQSNISYIINQFFHFSYIIYLYQQKKMRRQQPKLQSQIIQQQQEQYKQLNYQIPTQYQVETMFQKNGFRINNVVTKNQLKQLFDRQYALNNLQNSSTQNQKFNQQLFQQLWGQLQTLSDSTAKIQNISQVLAQAMTILKNRLKMINGSQGIQKCIQQLKQCQIKQKQLNQQMDMVDAQFDYHQEKIKAERNQVRIRIGKLRAHIQELRRDRLNFKYELEMLLLTVGEHQQQAPVENKIAGQSVMSMFGIEKKTMSTNLKFIFILTVICLILELFVLSYRNSFMTILGYFFILHVLFLGYYNDKSVVYIVVYLIFSMLLDLSYVGVNMFTKFIQSPIIYTYNTFFKYTAMLVIIVSVIGRILLVVKLLRYTQIPKNSEYFTFWGEEVMLNRRSKKYQPLVNQNQFGGIAN